MLTDPEPLGAALQRAHGGQWLPQALQARQTPLQHALAQLDTAQQRVLDAYLAAVLDLVTFRRTHDALRRRQERLHIPYRPLAASARQRSALSAIAEALDAFCAQVRSGLGPTTFEQRRAVGAWLIARVLVTHGAVEIR